MNLGRLLCLASAAVALATDALAQAQDSTAMASTVSIADTLRGSSGKLWTRLVGGDRSGSIRILRDLFGDSASQRPGVYHAPVADKPFSFINLIPFWSKESGKIGAYRVGAWPTERGKSSQSLPEGFIEVTAQNQDTRISEHFRLRDFLTHDQANVWPKYLVLREALVDKLELVIDELRNSGYPEARLVVLSGFRTPQYNARGVRRGGRAPDSRHQYGDAADVFVDVNGDGRMDDLNRDRRIDSRDARVLLAAVERVESAHPTLVGGASVYRATRSHGPFVHIDVRGTRARWGD